MRYFQRIEKKIVSWYYIKPLSIESGAAFGVTPSYYTPFWQPLFVRTRFDTGCWRLFDAENIFPNGLRTGAGLDVIGAELIVIIDSLIDLNSLKFIEFEQTKKIPVVLHYLVTNIVVDEYNTSISP